MRIVDRATFLAMPKGTVYTKYDSCNFGDLCVKDETLPGDHDWFYQSTVDAVYAESGVMLLEVLEAARRTGSPVRMDFDVQDRDGLFDQDQMFAVWDPQDVRGLIARLQRALTDAPRPGGSSQPSPTCSPHGQVESTSPDPPSTPTPAGSAPRGSAESDRRSA